MKKGLFPFGSMNTNYLTSLDYSRNSVSIVHPRPVLTSIGLLADAISTNPTQSEKWIVTDSNDSADTALPCFSESATTLQGYLLMLMLEKKRNSQREQYREYRDRRQVDKEQYKKSEWKWEKSKETKKAIEL